MPNIQTFLAEHSSTIALITNFLIMSATVVYARLTYTLVKETKLLRLSETSPSLSVYVMPREGNANILDIYIANNGNSPAIDIFWDLTLDRESWISKNVRFFEIPLFTKLNFLPPGEKIRTVFGNAITILNDTPEAITIGATYRDIHGGLHKQSFVIDAEQFRGMRTGSHPNQKAFDKLSKIADQLEYLIRHKDPVEIVAYSPKEYEEKIRREVDEDEE